jgi:hypothetical protein
MPIRRIPLGLMIVGFGLLLLLGRLEVSENETKLLLIVWTILFYGGLAIWFGENDRKTTPRSKLQASEPASRVVVDEFFDPDRIAMQNETYEWDQGANIDSYSESI